MKKNNSLLRFFAGLAMLVAGGYWFMSSVTVRTGFWGLHIGGFRITGGLVVIPFIIGIIWMFVNTDSVMAKILTGLGLVIILASVIMSTTFVFQSRTLYEYLIMLVLIFGGAAMTMQVLFSDPEKKSKKKKREDDEE